MSPLLSSTIPSKTLQVTMTLSVYALYPFFLFIFRNALTCSAAGGSWSLVHENAGISAMHMQLLPTDRVVMFDRADFGTSKIALPPGKCQGPKDCSAHSVEYDVAKKTVRPLLLQTDTWCSSGTLMPDGNLVQTGGWGKGDKVVRLYKSCDECDWKEIPNGLVEGRWYATNHMLPDHRQIVIGGRAQFNFEFIPKGPGTDKTFDFPFLAQTSDPDENNLYPFVAHYLGPVLFVFANNRAILFDYLKNQVVKTYPTMPGGQPRNYPSTGSAVLLPLRIKNGFVQGYEVLVCGGAYKTAVANALNGKFEVALDNCGRIGLSDPKPEWVMETMPIPRVMGDMVMLPNGEVLIINGATKGVAGWELGRDPALHPVIYKPDNKFGQRFEVQNPTAIPRMYHSTAVLLRQGDVLVAGSNPHQYYDFAGLFPTELRVESFKPSYLDPIYAPLRPDITIHNLIEMQYGKPFVIPFVLADIMDPKTISVNMVSLPFNTHSYSMNQRLLVLDNAVPVKQGVEKNSYIVGAAAPPSGDIAPPGYYMVFVVNKGIPSAGIWAKIG